MNLIILSIIASVLIGLMVAAVVYIVMKNMQAKDPDAKYREQVDSILGIINDDDNEDDYLDSEKPGVIDRWNAYWGKLFKEVSPITYSTENGKAGATILAIWAGVALVVSFAFTNILAGIVIASIAVFGISIILSMKARQKDSIIRNQLTGFLFALKANVSANMTPERALMKIVDNMPSPLYDELAPVKNQILSNMSFRDALIDLRERTTSDDLKFLCSCIIMATASGASLEQQIDTIRETVDERKRLSEEIAQAIKASTMNTYAASIIIPIGFIGTYLIDERAREFWFIDPLSWAALAVVLMLYGIGVFMSRKFVSKVRKL